MEINKDTLVQALLTAYPQLKDKLKDITPAFNLATSFLGKLLTKNTTLADISAKSGIDVNELITKIKGLIS